MFYIAFLHGRTILYRNNLNQPTEYTVDGQGSARPDHQGEDITQTQHWECLWQPTEYNKLQTASVVLMHTASNVTYESNNSLSRSARGQIPTPHGYY